MAQAAAIGAVVAGGALQAKGIMDDAKAQKEASDYNATLDRQNAELAVEQARNNEIKQRQYSSKVLGQARANYGASGITMEGSAMDVMAESAANAEMDALTIRHEGYLKSAAYKASAGLEEYRGRQAVASGRTKAFAALLGTAGKAAGMGAS